MQTFWLRAITRMLDTVIEQFDEFKYRWAVLWMSLRRSGNPEKIITAIKHLRSAKVFDCGRPGK